MLGAIFSSVKHIQMFQQNSYFLKRYFKWFKGQLKPLFFMGLIVFAAEVLFLALKMYIPLLILSLTECVIRFLICINVQKKAIKKLVFTKRIKRLITALSLIYIILVTVTAAVNNIYLTSVFIFICSYSFIFTVLSAFLMSFTEKAITNNYIKNAKKSLKSIPDLKIIAITGSYGKTSSKFILKRILSEKYNVVATPESFNTPMGIVRTVNEHLTPSAEIFIAEMGAKNIGDIKELCEIAKPDIAIITAVGPQHLETFKTIKNVQKTKFELCEYTQNVYVNFNSKYAREKAAEYVTHSFGTTDDCETYAKNIKVGIHGTEFDVVFYDKQIHLTTSLLGMHNVINIVGAVAVALSLDVSENQIKHAVALLKPTEHRLEKKSFLNGSILLDDSYNSNPEGSVEAANVLGSFKNKTKIAVTPGMVELGDKEYELNYNFGVNLAENSDILILVGKERSKPFLSAAKSVNFNEDNIFVVNSFKEAYSKLTGLCNKNTVVLFENDLPDNYVK